MPEPIKLALIYGSTREGRKCGDVVNWAVPLIERDARFRLDVIDPLKLDLPMRHDGKAHAGVSELIARIGGADAFIIVTPEYNHSFPSSIKFLIDSVYSEWQGKAVGFISYGGIAGGLRAVEQLRLVFAEMHAVTVRDGVSFNLWAQFGPDGALIDPAGPGQALALLLAKLHWWADALNQARAKLPYADAK